MSDVRQQLEGFVTLFEATRPSEAEAIEAGEIFTQGVEDLFLAQMDYAIAPAHTESGPRSVDIRHIFEAEDSSKLRIILRENSEEHASTNPLYRPVYGVFITEERPDSSEDKVIFYNKHKLSSVITRRDVSDDRDEEMKLREQMHPTPNFAEMTKEETAAYFQQLKERTEEGVKNLELEVALGFNEQPVGPDEIRGLLALLQSATPMAEADWDLMLKAKSKQRAQRVTDTSKHNAPEVISPEENATRLKKIARAAINFFRKNDT